ncbi:unnamed protein product [Candidatus Paraburkholderia kirkii UZHbot1]|uniref:WGS project CAFE00000000 data, contig bkir_c85 n=1 Tax=Candidatus Paraburkholderia kirkii UZHbot1 TaxID=1055526 RepID=U3UB79_9BURK|nr:unnamed protein product [Candidatus Paraburkholderia kirkii UZHbot1]
MTRSPEGDVGGVSAGVEIDVKAGSSSRRAMTHAASAVTARGLALAGAAPANFLRHNPKSADSKAWCATEAPSANAAGPPRFHHLPPACLALAGATCHSHSSSLNRIVVHRVTPITTMAKPSHCVFGNSRRVALTDTISSKLNAASFLRSFTVGPQNGLATTRRQCCVLTPSATSMRS